MIVQNYNFFWKINYQSNFFCAAAGGFIPVLWEVWIIQASVNA